jgi:hypothetical protein
LKFEPTLSLYVKFNPFTPSFFLVTFYVSTPFSLLLCVSCGREDWRESKVGARWYHGQAALWHRTTCNIHTSPSARRRHCRHVWARLRRHRASGLDSTAVARLGSTPLPPRPVLTPTLPPVRARLHRCRMSRLNSTAAASGLNSNAAASPGSTPPPLHPGSTPPSPRWPRSRGRARQWWHRCTSRPRLHQGSGGAVQRQLAQI